MKIFLLIAMMVLVVGNCAAQEPPSTQPENEPPQEDSVPLEDQKQPEAATPEPSANKEKEDGLSRGFQSLSDDIFQSARHPWGFSLSAYEGYSTDSVPGVNRYEDATITSLTPQMFLNLGRRKSKFHLDLGAGYRLYRHHKDLNGWDYSGSANYSYRFSRSVSLSITNLFTSSANDSSSSLSLFPSIRNIYPTNSREVLFDDRQRITRDSMEAELGFQLSRKARLSLSGGYDLYSYAQESITDTHALRVGAGFEYKLAKWLNFSSSYYDYLNKVDDSSRDIQIHRLTIGGFDFNLDRFWRIWMGGGIDFSHYQGRDRFQESVNAGISYDSRSLSLSSTYHRGLTSASGLSRLMQSDTFTESLGYRVTSRVSTRLAAYYTRSRESFDTGNIKTLAGNASLEFALRNDFFLSLNSSYQNQQQLHFSYGGLHVNRLSVYAGLQYVWPPRQRGDY